VTAVSSTSINVTWDIVPPIDQNGVITMYEVLYEPLETFGGAIMSNTITVNQGFRGQYLAGLEEHVDYNISVRAYTSVGAGPYSVGIVGMTDEDGECIFHTHILLFFFFISYSNYAAPSSPPSNVAATAVSSTSINVTWDIVPPIDQNGVITMYEVLYEPLETFDGAIMSNTTVVNEPVRTVVLTDLQEYVNYTISVRAFTSRGEGPYSDGITVLTLQDGKTLI
jgi:hypothetical protein